MADQKLRELTEITNPVSTDLVYSVHDPDGTPVDRKMKIGTLFGGAWVNLVKNSPGQIVTDGVEPQWWDDVANAAITDEDTAGEGIQDRFGRCFKVVTIANDVYGYQTLTFADELLLDAGVTVVSFSCWVYCATGAKASIGIYGTNLGLQESAQAGAGAWTLLRVENVILNAADTSIQIRLIVDTDTAWFACPMLNIGSKSLPWIPRGTQFTDRLGVTQVSGTTGDVPWTNTDCTANTHPLAVAVQCRADISEPNGTIGSAIAVSHHASMGDDYCILTTVHVLAQQYYGTLARIACDDSQIIRYLINEVDADSDVAWSINIYGYWRWAP